MIDSSNQYTISQLVRSFRSIYIHIIHYYYYLFWYYLMIIVHFYSMFYKSMICLWNKLCKVCPSCLPIIGDTIMELIVPILRYDLSVIVDLPYELPDCIFFHTQWIYAVDHTKIYFTTLFTVWPFPYIFYLRHGSY